MSDEVELGGKQGAGDDYEVVPVGPLRKLERRVDELQEQNQGNSGSDDKLVEDVIDIMKSNQKIVNDMTESTHELRNSVQDLTHKMDEVVDNMNDFMDVMTQASEMDMKGEVVGDIESRITNDIGNKMDEVVQELNDSNQEVVNHLQEVNKSLRRSYASENKEALLSADQRHQTEDNNEQGKAGQQQEQDMQENQMDQLNQQNVQGGDREVRQGRSRSVNSGRKRNNQEEAEMDLGGQNNDRLDRLREKFNKQKKE